MRQPEPGVEWRPFDSYAPAPRDADAAAELAGQWRSIRADPTFVRESAYRGVPLVGVLADELRWIFHEVLPECVRMVDIASAIVDRERPEAVIATYENGPYARALLLAAAQRGIPTIGLQHGIIFHNHYDYMHARITHDPAINPAGFAVPRVTCLWGQAWADTLTTAGHYPPESLAVTGSWKYDQLARRDPGVDAAAIKRRLGVPEGMPLTLVVSSAHETRAYIRASIDAARMAGSAVLIKPHPIEDLRPIRALLQEVSCPTARLFEGNLLEVLPAADLVCSQWSTVVSEAVLLNRPVILVNLQQVAGMEDYVRSGICLYVTTPQQQQQAVSAILGDSDVRLRLARAREHFIARYFLNTDGRAAERVVETVEACLRPNAPPVRVASA